VAPSAAGYRHRQDNTLGHGELLSSVVPPRYNANGQMYPEQQCLMQANVAHGKFWLGRSWVASYVILMRAKVGSETSVCPRDVRPCSVRCRYHLVGRAERLGGGGDSTCCALSGDTATDWVAARVPGIAAGFPSFRRNRFPQTDEELQQLMIRQDDVTLSVACSRNLGFVKLPAIRLHSNSGWSSRE
jgi:hypothetical protein